MSLLEVSGITLQEKDSYALRDVSFTQQEQQKLAIAGETGAGKSTLLQVIAGLVQPTAGTVRFADRRVYGPQEVLVPGHPGVAYLSQHSDLPRFLRVEQALRYANKRSAAEATTLYEVCRISHLLERRTDQLSGGERQRIALARLLLSSPRLLLLDEPFSNLDRGHKQILKSVIEDIGSRLGITCILISHDPTDTLSWADELLVLKAGQLIQQGPPQQVYAQPADEYTAGLFGDYNLLTGTAATAVAKLAGLRKKNQPLLVRPEQVRLAPLAGSGLPGTVRATQFFGSYYEVTVEVAGASIKAKTSTPDYLPGTQVAVTLGPGGAWFM
ncbi:ABC transporter ATP-binding protein [Hymenobacter sp. AT01-02]|uniref:ABC transporter ATP-binding protein n=1 Tax=Hymenobacter sp. AT01-02 TaxID=1571877 RepID=UPI0005F1DAF5|nr:ABC transporter ATP-binding protein [Hymenobacter sp. AT01-02]